MNKIKRIAAMIGVIVLVGMYVVTLILGLTASPATQNMLMASIVCTVVIPVLIYAMMLVARVLGSSNGKNPPNDENPEEKRSGKKNSGSKKGK
ncbi:MAG: hypothetical protein LUI87_10370 [Lachnospiraceae bacterium]|nr:hypothetical protein [Lachnospiraceae bacterium]